MTKHESYILGFPLKGLVETNAFGDQIAYSSVRLLNVRAFDAGTDRARGGKRPGTTKWSSAQVSGDADVQDLIHVVTSAAYSGNQSLSVRSITTVAVAGGAVRKLTSSAATSPANGSCTLSAVAPVLFSTEMFGAVYWCDGTNYSKYTVSTDTLATWVAASGSLPSSGSNVCRLIESWNGRIVMAGLAGDDHNWFMSKQNDATNWDYTPDPVTEQDATAGNNSLLGKIGDIINGIIPYNDDVLLFLGDHSIWQMSGDPMSGGRIDRVSDVVGGAWGRAWCKDSYGRVYFFGSRGGVYRMMPGEVPVRISGTAIDDRMRRVNLENHLIRMAWSDDEQGVYVWVVPLTDGAVADNYFYDARTEGWFVDRYANASYYPRAVYLYDGDLPADRAILLGGKDGYVRKVNRGAHSDDGTAIEARVFIGPIRPRGKTNEFVLDQIDIIMGSNTATMTDGLRIWAGEDEEAALAQASASIDDLLTESGEALILEEEYDTSGVKSEDVVAGSNYTLHPRVRANVAYLEFQNSAVDEQFSLERCEVRLKVLRASRR